MDKARLEQIKKRCEVATDGPWHNDSGNGQVESESKRSWRLPICDRISLTERENHCLQFNLELNPPHHPVYNENDMNFIAAARTDLPDLLAYVEKLEAEVEELKNQVTKSKA